MWNRRESKKLVGLLCGCMLAVLRANAETVPDLYAVSVPVAEQSQSELQRAAAAGLRELAVRISGRSDAAADAALNPAFANAMRYLEQYRYERNTASNSPWLAQLRFAPAPVDAELRRAGLPIWGSNRPALQAIVVVDDKNTRTVIDENSPFANALREQWRRRGLVLHLPRNASTIAIDDVMQSNIEKIAASLAEHADGFVLARVALAPSGACESNFSLRLGAYQNANTSKNTNTSPGAAAQTFDTQTFDARAFDTQTSGSDFSLCAANAIDRIVDNFSSQYAVLPNSGAEGIAMRVTGVVSFNDYAALLNYLRRLAAVKNVQPVFAHDDELLFQLKVQGSTEQLARQLALESRLAPMANASAENAEAAVLPPAVLSYRWTATPN